jgi:hypothetical protein
VSINHLIDRRKSIKKGWKQEKTKARKKKKAGKNELRKTNASTKLSPWICKDKGSFLQLIYKISSRSKTDEQLAEQT